MASIRTRPLVSAAAGIAGVAGAHVIAYAIAYRDPAQRAYVLQQTGHGYWPLAMGVACLAALITLAAAIRRGTDIGARRRAPIGTAGSVAQMGRLALWQMALFGAMESAERLSVGISPMTLLHTHNFAIGLTFQLILAAAIVIGLRVVERVTARVTRALSHTPLRSRPVHPSSWIDVTLVCLASTWPDRPRGPPLLAVA
ncbi:MAG TPA: hypothetical protein VF441_06685 [Acidimicrobiia bacterium]